MTTFWVSENGGAASTSTDVAPNTPGIDWIVSDEATYNANVAALQSAMAAARAAENAAADAAKLAAYTALVTLGVPAAVATTLSGYSPPVGETITIGG